MTDKYEMYLDKWLDGLYDEIDYWNGLLSGKYRESCKLPEVANPYKRFSLEDELPDHKDGIVKFVDVGSGVFSRCGKVTDKVKLEVLAIDPLAEVYKRLKRQYHVENGTALETGFVELLDKKFEKDTFDIVHMSNSLDHCFDAVFGIYQLLNICKVGGKVILRHHENEADRAEYKGLHQWNLSLHNEESSFIIWRKDKRYDICKLFSEYADIKLYPDVEEEESGWVYNKVVMIKKKEIIIPFNQYADIIWEKVYAYLTGILFDNVMLGTGNREDMQKRILSKGINEIDIELVKSKLNGNKVIIYGMGKIGLKLIDYFDRNGIEIVDVIDKRNLTYKAYQSVHIDEMTEENKRLPIVVTVLGDCMEVEDILKKSGWQNVLNVKQIMQKCGGGV